MLFQIKAMEYLSIQEVHIVHSHQLFPRVVREQIRLQLSRFPLLSPPSSLTRHTLVATNTHVQHAYYIIVIKYAQDPITVQYHKLHSSIMQVSIPSFLLSSFERDEEKKEDQILFYYIFVEYQAHH